MARKLCGCVNMVDIGHVHSVGREVATVKTCTCRKVAKMEFCNHKCDQQTRLVRHIVTYRYSPLRKLKISGVQCGMYQLFWLQLLKSGHAFGVRVVFGCLKLSGGNAQVQSQWVLFTTFQSLQRNIP